jgi:hypothetical protein
LVEYRYNILNNYMMNEEKNIVLPKTKTRKTKTKTAKKVKVKKMPFGLDSNMALAMPRAEFKAKEKSPNFKSNEPKNIYRKIAVSFIVLTLILVAAVLYFGFSKLTIVIIPSQEKITDTSSIEIVNQASNSALAPNQAYGIIKEMPVEQTKEFASSGKEILGEEVIGKVIIFNNYTKNQPLVATTRLLTTDNKLFRLKNTVNVPAGGKIEAEVYADVAKSEMAIGPSKFILPGLWAGIQDKIYAESKEAMKYSQKVKYNITQSDIDNAVSQLKSDLLANAEKQAGQTYKDYTKTLFKVDNNSVVQEVSGKVGEEKEKFTIKMKVMVAVVAFNDDEIYNQIKAKLIAELADDKEISKFDKQDMVYTLVNFDIAQATAMVNIDSTAQVSLKDSANIIKKNNLTGLNFEQLKTYLNGLPEVAGYQINFSPSFIKKAPDLVDRIEIKIKK